MQVGHVWHEADGLVFIGAAGIAVRAVAGFVQAKAFDPAVVVVDQQGRHAICLLGGHAARGNDLARAIARHLGGEAVVTTASDVEARSALDLVAAKRELQSIRPKAMPRVQGAMLAGEAVQLYDPEGYLADAPADMQWIVRRSEEEWAAGPGVWVHWRSPEQDSGQAQLTPRAVGVGLGFRRGVDGERLAAAVREILARERIPLEAVAALGTVQAKGDESGAWFLARDLGRPIFFFSATELGNVRVPTPSARVAAHMGTESVCEAAARVVTGGGEIILQKSAQRDLTVALAVGSRSWVWGRETPPF